MNDVYMMLFPVLVVLAIWILWITSVYISRRKETNNLESIQNDIKLVMEIRDLLYVGVSPEAYCNITKINLEDHK